MILIALMILIVFYTCIAGTIYEEQCYKKRNEELKKHYAKKRGKNAE